MDYTSAKATNIILGFVSLGLESYNYNEAMILQRIDDIFISVVSICTLEAIVSLILACCCKNKFWSLIDQIVRGIICIALMYVGGSLIYSAIDINKRDDCQLMQTLPYTYIICQYYEVKIAAGIVAIINSLVYGSTKKIQKPQKETVYEQQAGPAVAAPITIVQSQDTSYIQEQQDYRIPRYYPQQNYNYNPNYVGAPQIQYPRRNNPLQQNTSPNQYQYDYNPNYNPHHQQGFHPHPQHQHNQRYYQ